MTSSEIRRLDFTRAAIDIWGPTDPRHANWPVVYVLDDAARRGGDSRLSDVYVGESRNAVGRMLQHLTTPEKQHLRSVRVIVDETFNKSACLDLESYLIRMLAGDGAFRVLNRNDGITEADYYDRPRYQEAFRDIFDELKDDGVFTRTIPQIENSDLFKLSPFKALTQDQAVAANDILEGLFSDIEAHEGGTIVIEGEPGTGKTVIAIYLLKLLRDIADDVPTEDLDSDSLFSEYFVEGYAELLEGVRIGMVVPQQSLRKSIQKVFRKTPGLNPSMVMTPFQAGESSEHFDILIVDEAHRLNQRANQPSGPQNMKFAEITTALFGFDDKSKTQLDWIREKSTHQILLLDAAQAVRPADMPAETWTVLQRETTARRRNYRLTSQMRVAAGSDYVGYVRGVLSGTDVTPRSFPGYDLRMFDSVSEMHAAIRERDAERGLSRLVAGYAWPWASKNAPEAFDLEFYDTRLRWNSTQTDWIAATGSLEEVGSIHTVQGYDLNYVGVIIGPDVRLDPVSGRIVLDRASYFDTKGKENNKALGRSYTDDEILQFVLNIYAVLLTRGIRGTYVYVHDENLRAMLRPFI